MMANAVLSALSQNGSSGTCLDVRICFVNDDARVAAKIAAPVTNMDILNILVLFGISSALLISDALIECNSGT